MKLTNDDKIKIFDIALEKVLKMILEKIRSRTYTEENATSLRLIAKSKTQKFRKLFIESGYDIDKVSDPYIEEDLIDSVKIIFDDLATVLIRGFGLDDVVGSTRKRGEENTTTAFIQAEASDDKMKEFTSMTEQEIRDMLGIEKGDVEGLAGMTIIRMDENGKVLDEQEIIYDKDGNPREDNRAKPLEDYTPVAVGDEVMMSDDFGLNYLANSNGKVVSMSYEMRVEKFSGKKAFVKEIDCNFPFLCDHCDNIHHANTKIRFVDDTNIYYTNNRFLTKYIELDINNI